MAYTVSFTSICLTLSGIRWHIHAGDVVASTVVAMLGETMSLPPADFPSQQNTGIQNRELHVFIDPESSGFSSGGYTSGPLFCFLPPLGNNDMLVLGMSYIAMTIARAELSRGGLLVHGALAKTPDYLGGSVILAGSGTVGKTTASKRLPAPWLSLSDDSSLLLRDGRGQYVAHPWPTWSRFYCDLDGKPGPGGKWDVQYSVPLQALFFLAQAEEDQIKPLSPTPAVAYLTETVQHISSLMTRDLTADEAQSLYSNQMTAAKDLVRAIPAYTLHVSLTGAFWNQIEETLIAIPSISGSQTKQLFSVEDTLRNATSIAPPELSSDNTLTVNYSGSSMNPTLRHPDLLQVTPYADKTIQCGDVIYFNPPTEGPKVVHRVIRVTAKGIYTRGDNNQIVDPYILQPADIIGKVTATWRHGKLRKIAGGVSGTWTGYRAGIYNKLNKIVSLKLHGIYHSFSASGFFRYILPASFQPRIFEFKHRYLPSTLKLIVNGRIIGQYDVWKKLWLINRPWRLIIDEKKLPIITRLPPMETTHLHNDDVENKTP